MKFYQSGRSMVEMLGVLAIIGVLSVGAISGYSKAMMKYKLNKQTEQLSTVLYNSITSSSEFTPPPANPGTSSVQYLTPIYIKLGYIPGEMIKGNQTYDIYDIFNNKIFIRYINWETVQYIETSFEISTSGYDLFMQQCLNIFSLFKMMSTDLYSISVYKGFNDSTQGGTVSNLAGDIKCTELANNSDCLRDMDLIEFRKQCDLCMGASYCRFNITYKNER